MKEIKFNGTVYQKDNGSWCLINEKEVMSSGILVGIDELLDNNNMLILEENEEVEIIVRLKNRK